MIERRLRHFRKPHCGSIRVDETYIKIRGEWRYLYRALDKHGTPVDFLLTAKCHLEAAERFIRTLKENLLWVRAFDTVEELRQALLAFRESYNTTRLIERHGFQTPAAVRQRQL